MTYIRLLLRFSNLFIFIFALYAFFASNHMLTSMYGPISIELESLNTFFGLALLLASLFLFKIMSLKKHDLFLCIILLFFFSFVSYMIQSTVVQISLGPLVNYYKLIIYLIVVSLFISVIYMLKNSTDKYFLKQNSNKNIF